MSHPPNLSLIFPKELPVIPQYNAKVRMAGKGKSDEMTKFHRVVNMMCEALKGCV
jgi:hypothetical protein